MTIQKDIHSREIELKDLQKAYEYAKGYTQFEGKELSRWSEKAQNVTLSTFMSNKFSHRRDFDGPYPLLAIAFALANIYLTHYCVLVGAKEAFDMRHSS